jgi:hypothetical protein
MKVPTGILKNHFFKRSLKKSFTILLTKEQQQKSNSIKPRNDVEV